MVAGVCVSHGSFSFSVIICAHSWALLYIWPCRRLSSLTSKMQTVNDFTCVRVSLIFYCTDHFDWLYYYCCCCVFFFCSEEKQTCYAAFAVLNFLWHQQPQKNNINWHFMFFASFPLWNVCVLAHTGPFYTHLARTKWLVSRHHWQCVGCSHKMKMRCDDDKIIRIMFVCLCIMKKSLALDLDLNNFAMGSSHTS